MRETFNSNICSKCTGTLRYKNTGRCVLCSKTRAQRYRQSSKGRLTELKAHRRRRYGLTNVQYENFLSQQQNQCSICSILLNNSTKLTTPHVDHDHKTGIVRGILCDSCNRMLGCARDNSNILLKAVSYLKNSQSNQCS